VDLPVINAGPSHPAAPRNGNVEVMRLVAAAGIVWFHAHAWGQMISYSALSLFIVFLIVLPLQRPPTGSFGSYISERADRLLRPWLVWSAIFALLKIAQATLQKQPIVAEFDWPMLATGTHTHLWFLPFGFVCSIAAFAIARSTDRTSGLVFSCAVVLAALSVPASAWALDSRLSEPWAQWCYGLPAVLFGLAIHFAGADRLKLGIISLATIVSWAATTVVTELNWGFNSLVIGVNLAMFALSTHISSRPWMRWAAAVSMPVYLSHPIFISLLYGEAGIENDVAVAISAILLSIALGAAVIGLGWERKLL
jgi:peptidoglycan/LPS O-acetylase OafA/YrhL